ncbi:methionine ABC transporter permease [Vagococcus silagei]|uniref:ABC transporter permease n=1 Tax=Vagococcus silagei TaxID=2508885 RepID=A0A4S3B289_9ENTE|nr:methionine ABC transporter permease [Vagococcus silagei]THB61244.1 ABC transporter permease [Vagococcus silagei]
MDKSFVETYFNWSEVQLDALLKASKETLYMTFVSTLFVAIIGLLIGLLLFIFSRKNTKVNRTLYTIVSVISNTFRSIPFIILLILLFPVANTLFGSMIGPTSALPALILSASPFYARMVEIAFREVDQGVIEASEAMGASLTQIIWKVLIPESLPALISGITVTTITMIGFTAMAGAVGAGGLGNLAYQTGYAANKYTVITVSTVLILVLVFIVQWIGDLLVKKIDKR